MNQKFKRILSWVLTVCILGTTFVGVPLQAVTADSTDKSDLKVLHIGNSYGRDAYEYLYEILNASGLYNRVVIGDLFESGQSAQGYVSNILSDAGVATAENPLVTEDELKANSVHQQLTGQYYKSEGTNKIPYVYQEETGKKVADVIGSEDWDVVTIQTAPMFMNGGYEANNQFLLDETLLKALSDETTMADITGKTYTAENSYFDVLIDYVKKHNPNAKVMFYTGLINNRSDYTGKYNDIRLSDGNGNTVNLNGIQKMVNNQGVYVEEHINDYISGRTVNGVERKIDGIIPANMALGYLYEAYDRNTNYLMRDDVHWADIGRYATGLVYFEALSGQKADKVIENYKPNFNIISGAETIKAAVDFAGNTIGSDKKFTAPKYYIANVNGQNLAVLGNAPLRFTPASDATGGYTVNGSVVDVENAIMPCENIVLEKQTADYDTAAVSAVTVKMAEYMNRAITVEDLNGLTAVYNDYNSLPAADKVAFQNVNYAEYSRLVKALERAQKLDIANLYSFEDFDTVQGDGETGITWSKVSSDGTTVSAPTQRVTGYTDSGLSVSGNAIRFTMTEDFPQVVANNLPDGSKIKDISYITRFDDWHDIKFKQYLTYTDSNNYSYIQSENGSYTYGKCVDGTLTTTNGTRLAKSSEYGFSTNRSGVYDSLNPASTYANVLIEMNYAVENNVAYYYIKTTSFRSHVTNNPNAIVKNIYKVKVSDDAAADSGMAEGLRFDLQRNGVGFLLDQVAYQLYTEKTRQFDKDVNNELGGVILTVDNCAEYADVINTLSERYDALTANEKKTSLNADILLTAKKTIAKIDDVTAFVTAHPLASVMKANNSFGSVKDLINAINADTAAKIEKQIPEYINDYNSADKQVQELLVANGYYNEEALNAALIRTAVYTKGVFKYNENYKKYLTDESGYIIAAYTADVKPVHYSTVFQNKAYSDYAYVRTYGRDAGDVYAAKMDDRFQMQKSTWTGVKDETTGKYDGYVYASTTKASIRLNSSLGFAEWNHLGGWDNKVAFATADFADDGTYTNLAYSTYGMDFDIVEDTNGNATMNNITTTSSNGAKNVVTNASIKFFNANDDYDYVMTADAGYVKSLTITYDTDALHANLDTDIRMIGRSLDVDGGKMFSWGGNGFTFSFKGTGAYATIKAQHIDHDESGGNNSNDNNCVTLDVFVDGKYTKSIKVNEDQTDDVCLATDLDDTKEHTIKAIKHAGARYSCGILSDVRLTDGEFLTAPAKTRYIEAIGDSITEGYGLGADTQVRVNAGGINFNTLQNTTGQIAEMFDADLSAVAVSGIGILSQCYQDDDSAGGMPAIYDYVDAYNDAAKTEYDFKNVPDVIIYNLGTNDSGANCAAATAKTEEFINHIWTKYNDESIPVVIWFGIMGDESYKTSYSELAAKMQAAGKPVYFVEGKSGEYNATAHPTYNTFTNNVPALAKTVAEVTGWDTGYGDIIDYYPLFNRIVKDSDAEAVANLDTVYSALSAEAKAKITAVTDEQIKDLTAKYPSYKLVETDGVTYCYKGDTLIKGEFVTINGNRYYFRQSDGAMFKNIVALIGGELYQFDKDGNLTENEKKIVNNKCFYGTQQLYGWQTIGGNRYYFSLKTGEMVKDYIGLIGSTVGKFDESGVYSADENYTINGQKCYAVTDTAYTTPVTGWVTIYGKQFYFRKTNGNIIVDASKQTSRALIGGQLYTFTKAGYSITEVTAELKVGSSEGVAAYSSNVIVEKGKTIKKLGVVASTDKNADLVVNYNSSSDTVADNTDSTVVAKTPANGAIPVSFKQNINSGTGKTVYARGFAIDSDNNIVYSEIKSIEL